MKKGKENVSDQLEAWRYALASGERLSGRQGARAFFIRSQMVELAA
jgi:hypothetical protein